MAKPINVVIKGDYTDNDINRAIRDLERLKTQSGTTGGALGVFQKGMVAAGGALAAAFSFDAVISAMKDAAQAAMEDEKSMVALATAMDNVGLSSKNAEAEGLIESMMLQTGIADDRLRPAFQKLVTVTNDVGEAQRLLKLSTDLAAAGYGDLTSTSKALSAAANGNFTALQRLRVPIDAGIIAAKDFEGAIDALNKVVGGQAAAAADTYAGQMARVKVAVDEAQEAIGYALLRAVDDMVRSLGGTSGLQAQIIKTGDDIALLIDGVRLLNSEFQNLIGPLKTVLNLSGGFNGPQGGGLIDWMKSVLSNMGPIGRTVATLVSSLQVLGLQSQQAAASSRGLTSATVQSGIAAGKAGRNIGVLAEETEIAGEAAFAAAKGYYAFYEATAAAARIQRDLANTSGSVIGAIQQGFSERFLAGPGKFASLYGEVERAARGAAGGTRAAKDATSEYDSKLKEHQDTLQNAIKAAQDYATSVSQTFVNGLDLSAALDAAKESGKSIVDEFIAQGERMKAFSENMQRLLGAGLSRTAFDAIIRAGADRGADIANALANGNIAENVRNVNKVYDSVAQMGDIVGNRASYNFELAGIVTAQGFLESFIKEFMPAGKKRRQLLSSIDDMVNEAMAKMGRLMGMSMPSFGTVVGAGGGALVNPQGLQVPIPTGLSPSETSDFIDGILMGGAVPFAEGGIVTRPTLGVFGEAGPEAVIPLDRMGSGGNTYNINVSTGVGDPRQIGEQVVSYIKRFEAASGPVFARA